MGRIELPWPSGFELRLSLERSRVHHYHHQHVMGSKKANSYISRKNSLKTSVVVVCIMYIPISKKCLDQSPIKTATRNRHKPLQEMLCKIKKFCLAATKCSVPITSSESPFFPSTT